MDPGGLRLRGPTYTASATVVILYSAHCMARNRQQLKDCLTLSDRISDFGYRYYGRRPRDPYTENSGGAGAWRQRMANIPIRDSPLCATYDFQRDEYRHGSHVFNGSRRGIVGGLRRPRLDGVLRQQIPEK